MHRFDESAETLARAILDYALERVRMDPPPLDRSRTPRELAAAAGRTITPAGIGGEEALRVFADALAPDDDLGRSSAVLRIRARGTH